jgi:hypothetical protein
MVVGYLLNGCSSFDQFDLIPERNHLGWLKVHGQFVAEHMDGLTTPSQVSCERHILLQAYIKRSLSGTGVP